MAEPVVPGRLQGAPPGPVLTAFGARGASPQRLSGGAGRAWSAGGLVLKPVDDEAEATWAADVLSGLAEDGFRINRPVRSDSGRWVVDGWAAWGALAGRHDASGRWLDVLIAGERFTAALQGLERPAFLDSRTHAWAAADRMAWDEAPLLVIHDRFRPLVERLLEHVGPHDSPSQVIHGDLAGNVLLAPGHPPGIIDFTPYWRPAPFCSAVVVVDASSGTAPGTPSWRPCRVRSGCRSWRGLRSTGCSHPTRWPPADPPMVPRPTCVPRPGATNVCSACWTATGPPVWEPAAADRPPAGTRRCVARPQLGVVLATLSRWCGRSSSTGGGPWSST